MTTSLRQNVLILVVDLRAACMPVGQASHRTIATTTTRSAIFSQMQQKEQFKKNDMICVPSRHGNPYMSLVMNKPDFRICENKEADQLRSNCAADQRLCFRYTDSSIPLLPKSEISSLLWLYSPVCVGPGWKPRKPVFS